MNTKPIWKEVCILGAMALPVAIGTVGERLMILVDLLMVGRLGDKALAAVALGNTYSLLFLILGMGVLFGLDPLVARAAARGRSGECAELGLQGVVLALLVSVPVTVAHLAGEPLLRLCGQSAELSAETGRYLQAQAPGVPFLLVFVSLRQFLQGNGMMTPATVVIALANGMNALANYALIYGSLGCPALGVVGAGWATTISRVLMALSLIGYVWLTPSLKEQRARLHRRAIRLSGLVRLSRIGLPIGLQCGLEVSVFTVVAFFMGSVGTRELAAYQIAMNLAVLVFVVPLGISAAACVRVSQQLGRRDSEGTLRTTASALLLAAGLALLPAGVFLLFPETLARLHTDDPGLVELAASLIPLAAAFLVADSVQAVACGILRGFKETRLPAVINVCGYWLLGLPVGYALTFGLGIGPSGFWWGLTTGLTFVALALALLVARRLPRTLPDGKHLPECRRLAEVP